MTMADKRAVNYDDFVTFMQNYTVEIVKRFATKKEVATIQSAEFNSDITEDFIKSLFPEDVVKEYEEGENI